jgi:dTDP-4-amino-4,6-dideoxygalactose transaminase
MQAISMVDLKGQYLKMKDEIDKSIQTVIETTQFIKGPEVKYFQEELQSYLGVKHVIACGNGTDALQIAMMALDLKPGDEVITTNFTFIATVEVIGLLGLKPILVDVDAKTFNIDVSQIENAITPKTKAIVPVHLFGQTADMEAIMEIANKYHLFVIEDNAQAIGATYTFSNGKSFKAGTIGHIGCTSFFPSKNLGCYGDGGAMMTDDDVLAEKISSIVNHGMKVRYYHDRIGVNSRLDTIQAAILRVKLPRLDSYNQARQSAANYYNQAFHNISGLETPIVAPFTDHIYHQYTLKVKNGKRDLLKKWLDEQGIPCMVYYPVPLDQQKAFLRYKTEKHFPVTEELCQSVISLPMHTELSDEQLHLITSKVKEFFKS